MAPEWVAAVCPDLAEAPGATEPQRLRELVAAVRDANTSQDANALVAAWLGDPAAVRQTAEAYVDGSAAVEALWLELAGRPGLRDAVGRVRGEVRRAAKRVVTERRHETATTLPSATQVGDLRLTLERPDLPDGVVCPPGWRIELTGLVRVRVDDQTGEVEEVPVTRRPILVTARLEDVGTGQLSLRVEWPGTDRWTHRVVPRRLLLDRKDIVGLAAWDAPVNSNDAPDIVRFLAEQEEASRTGLPLARVASTLGWQGRGGDDGFLWGRTHLVAGQPDAFDGAIDDLPPSAWRPGRIHLLADHGQGSLADGFHRAGTWEGWAAALEHVRSYPVVWLAIYAALVPPLMRTVPTLPNFILDLCGSTSQGKTTALRLAASVWGSPDERDGGLVRSWDNTRVWIERTAAFLGHLPLILDDTKRARKPEEVGRTLYDFANGIGRGRGSLDGTRDVGTWRSVLLSSGEAPATSFTQDGGTRARTICVWGSPFDGGGVDAALAVRAVTDAVRIHYGHAGRRVVRWLLETPDAARRVQGAYQVHLAAWTREAGGNPVASRAAQYVAGMAVAADVLHNELGVPRPRSEPLARAWAAVLAGSEESDRPRDALRAVLSWAAQHQGRLSSRSTESGPPGGLLGTWQSHASGRRLALLPHALQDFLQQQGFDPEAVLRTWDDRGWLVRDGRHRTVKVQVGDDKARCTVITAAAIEDIGGGDRG
jgi:putative DNA primase/helicase